MSGSGQPHLCYRAAWVLPITSPPIRNGLVEIDGDRIAGVRREAGQPGGRREVVDLGEAAILPGLVNAHTHLELSWMRGRIGAFDRFTDWVRTLMALRAAHAPSEPYAVAAASDAIAEAERSGTALIGDVSNTLACVGAFQARGVSALVFHELIGFNPDDPAAMVRRARARSSALPCSGDLRVAIAAHAPYSVAPPLLRAIRADLDAHAAARSSVHLAESGEEVEFLRSGTGPWRTVLEEVGAWDPRWTPPACDPATYLDRHGFLDERILAVHGVQLANTELRSLAEKRMTIVTCPRGNIKTGAGAPPVRAFYEAGLRVAVGTDSLASVDDLNLFSELALMRRLAPDVPAARLLASATRAGALALGFDSDFGAIEPGLRARLIAVHVPAAERNVEEYLVHGVAPEQIQWLPTRS
jgi:cytosine/adenosine deaminase-related metal-dependent hydrolase